MAIDHRRIFQISELQMRKPPRLPRFGMEDDSERTNNQDSVRFHPLLLAWQRDAKRCGNRLEMSGDGNEEREEYTNSLFGLRSKRE